MNENDKQDQNMLSVEDLDLTDLEIAGLDNEDALGVPEMGASEACYGSSTTQTG